MAPRKTSQASSTYQMKITLRDCRPPIWRRVQAQQLHGKKGEGCWHEKRCPSKRSYYRDRQQINEKWRLQYQQQMAGVVQEEGQVETVTLPVAEDSIPCASLYSWREKRLTR